MFSFPKVANLKDIKRLLVYVPPIFIAVIAVVILVIMLVFLQHQKETEIKLSYQEEQFKNRELLNSYIENVKYNASGVFNQTEQDLRITVSKIIGYIQAKNLQGEALNQKEFQSFLSLIEKSKKVNIVIYNSQTLELFYGEDIIEYLQTLTNSQLMTQKIKEKVLDDIYRLGNGNLKYWIDNQIKMIKLSYFEEISEQKIFIGAFSNINDMKTEIKKAIFESILMKSKSIDGHFWFYDYINNIVFNYNNQSKALSLDHLIKQSSTDEERALLKQYFKHPDLLAQNSESIYNFSKYQFLISIDSDRFEIQRDRIEAKYLNVMTIFTLIMLIVMAFLMAILMIFGRYISNILTLFNKRLEIKNRKYKQWQERYELAIIASNDGLWDIDLVQNRIYFSKKWLEMFGYKRNDLVTYHDWFNLIHNEDKNRVQNNFNAHIIGKDEHFIVEYRILDANGRYRWVLARGKVFRDDEQKPIRMLMMSMDIDSKKELTKELQDVELLVETGRLIICRLKYDEKLSIEYISKSIESYGYVRHSFRNRVFIDFIYNEDRVFFIQLMQQAIEKGLDSFSATYRIVESSGKVTWVFSRILILKDHSGNVAHLYGYINDIDKIKITEEELKAQVETEVEKNREKDRLLINQNKLASMGEMLGSIAHQWRQPLNNISLLIHFIRDNFQNKSFSKAQLEDVIETTKIQIDYMSRTIDDFRNFYEPNKEKVHFDIKESLVKASKIVRTSFEKNDMLLEIEGEDVSIISYENELQQVIVNILNNAVDAAIEKRSQKDFSPFVKVLIEKSDKNAIIALNNNCGNLENSILDKIFEPYFTTKFENQGTGIGLYMSKIIIEKNMKGRIEAKNIEEGMSFVITLPL